MLLNVLFKGEKLSDRRKNDITDECRVLICKAYGEYTDSIYNENGLVCESKIFSVEDLGYRKNHSRTASTRYKWGKPIVKAGKMVADKDLRSIEIVPLKEDVEEYFQREIKSRISDAWIDSSKTKIGYEIIYGKLFYKPALIRNSVDILKAIQSIDEKEFALLTTIKKNFEERTDGILRDRKKFKETGIEWFPVIPADWDVVKGKYVLELQKRPVREDDGVITCFRDGEVTLRSNRREEGFTFADKEIGYQGNRSWGFSNSWYGWVCRCNRDFRFAWKGISGIKCLPCKRGL